jgi:hypothetical protein
MSNDYILFMLCSVFFPRCTVLYAVGFLTVEGPQTHYTILWCVLCCHLAVSQLQFWLEEFEFPRSH